MKVQIIGGATTKAIEALGMSGFVSGGGWVEGLLNGLGNEESIDKIQLVFFSPSIDAPLISRMGKFEYRAIPVCKSNLTVVSKNLKNNLTKAYNDFLPDIIHIIGSGDANTDTASLIAKEAVVPRVLSITGIPFFYTTHYFAFLKHRDLKIRSIGDFLRGRSIFQQKRLFDKRVKFDKSTFENVDAVIGRTEWDYACAKQLNNKLKYYSCGEVLRENFYSSKKWDVKTCERYSIFMSQGTYPLKGLHLAIDALAIIKTEYPEVKLYVSATNIILRDGIKNKLRFSSYGKLILRKIKKYNLEQNICFVGSLDAKGMVDMLLKANVFILPSSIENSPNSLGEAMLLGVPSVASYVGGVPSILDDQTEGFLYPADEDYMLAHYVMKIFSDNVLAERLSKSAIKRAEKTYSSKDISKKTIEIYKDVLRANEKQ